MLDDENDPFSPNSTDDPFYGNDELGFLSWDDLATDVADEVEEEADGICDHKEKQIYSKPLSGGISAVGFGASAGAAIEKVYCPKCNQAWELDQQDDTRGQNFLGL